MSTDYQSFTAVIPSKFVANSNDPAMKFFVEKLTEIGLAQTEENGDISFPTISSGFGDYIDDYYLPESDETYLKLRTEESKVQNELLNYLIETKRVCLVYRGGYCSNGSGLDDYCQYCGAGEKQVWDPVAEAERIPTLVLREILAKRLESE